mmetsp:Transcript_66732/g.184411  ORF Transcript_66732/g.184411 Transcript_66732/m.184411 type:complete len:495 (+) Transcript_66732:411-1895(+)
MPFLRGTTDIEALGGIDPVDDLGILVLDHPALQLLRRGKLVALLGEVRGKDGEFMDLEGVVLADLPVAICCLDGRGDRVDPYLVVHGLHDGGDLGIDLLRTCVQLLRPCALPVGSDGLEGDQGDVVLPLVAEHHDVADAVARPLHALLDGHGCDVLAALADDELLVPPGDLHHALRGDHALVAGVEPPLGIDGLGVLGLDVPEVLGAKVRACHVPHHDRPPAEAELALVLLLRALEVGGPGALRLPVDVLGVHREDLHLEAGHLPADGAPLVRLLRGHGAGAGALRHAVGLVDADAEGAEELQRVPANRRGGGEPVLALVQAQAGLDLREHDLVRESVPPRHCAVAAELRVPRQLEGHAFGGGGDLLLQRRRHRTQRADLIGNLLPDEGDAQEERRPGDGQAVLQGLLPHVVGPREEAARRPRERGGDEEGDHDVHEHAGDVGERQVGEHPLLPLAAEAAALVEHRRERCGLEDDVVVGDHHRLRLAGGPRGVD